MFPVLHGKVHPKNFTSRKVKSETKKANSIYLSVLGDIKNTHTQKIFPKLHPPPWR